MNKTPRTPVEIYEKGINPYAIILYNVLYLLCGRSPEGKTKAKNGELADFLKWDIKTVKKYIRLLKKLNLIVVSGETRNRTISCNEPDEILKSTKIYKKPETSPECHNTIIPEQKTINLKKLRAEKWLIEYLEDVPIKERLSDLQLYIRTAKPEIDFGDRVILEEKGDIKRAITFNPEDFTNFMFSQNAAALQKEQATVRAGEYDRDHKETFKADLEQFYKNNLNIEALSAYKHRKYSKLSDCPCELQKIFLSWLEPELF
jgi:hypothetical protein